MGADCDIYPKEALEHVARFSTNEGFRWWTNYSSDIQMISSHGMRQLGNLYWRRVRSLTKVATRMQLQGTLTEGRVIRNSALEAGCWSTTPYSANLLGGLFYR